jgi:hypothetical protein
MQLITSELTLSAVNETAQTGAIVIALALNDLQI